MDELLPDFWNTIKEYIPAGQRQTVADHAVSVLIDEGASDELLYALKDCDKYMKSAVLDQLGEEEDIDAYDDDDYGYDDD